MVYVHILECVFQKDFSGEEVLSRGFLFLIKDVNHFSFIAQVMVSGAQISRWV